MKLTIRRKDPEQNAYRALTAHDYDFELNGMPLTEGIMKLELTMEAQDVNRAKITFMVDDVDVDLDTLADLIAVVVSEESE